MANWDTTVLPSVLLFSTGYVLLRTIEVGRVKARQSKPQAVTRGEALFSYSLVGAFVLLGVIGVLHHAMWRDETHGWLVARFSKSLSALYIGTRYEAHFILWNFLLWILTRFTHDCQAMQWFHLGLATGSVWLVVHFGPFTRIQKALYCFGYFAFFEYCLVCREYVCIGLLMFSLCALRGWRKDSFVPQALILFLLSNINVFATFIAFSFVAAAALEHFRSRDLGQLWTTKKWALIFSGLILCAAVLGDGLQSIKPADALIARSWQHPITAGDFAVALSNVWRGYVPIPTPFPLLVTAIEGSSHFVRLIWGSNFLLDYAPQTLPFGVILSLGLLAASTWTLRRSPMAVAWYLSGTCLMLLFQSVINPGALRHHGLFFILYIACLWCGFTRARDQKPRSPPASLPLRLERFFLPSILALQVVAGAYAWTLHLMMPFSASQLAANFIREHGYANLLIIGSKESLVAPVTAYLDRPIYYPDSERYGTYTLENTTRHDLTPPELVQSVAQMAMKAQGDTLLIWDRQFTSSQGGITEALKSAWLSPDGHLSTLSKPPPEPRMKLSMLADFRFVIGDEVYSLYLINPP